ncbi:alpha/beta fold hydrolase [Arthrobacter sp. NPDC058192]|uniref:alpha/beta fold hydrolase n=1 Tax=Arthrobacter sp. NPDC058192 TaxID=3346372 RepID=UPI0036F0D9E6
MTAAQRPAERTARSGMFGNGMEYLCWGSGPKTLLFIQGGPGSAVPQGMMRRMIRRQFEPYLDAGFSVWVVTRRRNMPHGHTIADMAGDYAHVITEEFGGHVDVVVAESFGGMIAQYLAALHPDASGRIVVVVAAAELSDWGKDFDTRMAGAIANGDAGRAGTVFAEYLFPETRLQWLRRLLGPLIGGRLLAASDYPPEDVKTEARAELSFNSREVLPRIQPPVLLICGDSDRFFPKDVAAETAGLIPDCTLIWYEGLGHLRVAASSRVARDVLAFVSGN